MYKLNFIGDKMPVSLEALSYLESVSVDAIKKIMRDNKGRIISIGKTTKLFVEEAKEEVKTESKRKTYNTSVTYKCIKPSKVKAKKFQMFILECDGEIYTTRKLADILNVNKEFLNTKIAGCKKIMINDKVYTVTLKPYGKIIEYVYWKGEEYKNLTYIDIEKLTDISSLYMRSKYKNKTRFFNGCILSNKPINECFEMLPVIAEKGEERIYLQSYKDAIEHFGIKIRLDAFGKKIREKGYFVADGYKIRRGRDYR